MTTHSPDEVDMLADRIAFMTDGELNCCGSKTFMRKRFGIYRLSCVKNVDCKSITTTKLLDVYYPGITVERETESQLSYLLSCDKIDKFGRIFEKFETFYASYLKLKSFGVSIVTAESLFREFNKDLASDESSVQSFDIEDNSGVDCSRGIVLIPYQFLAMCKKRFLCGIRDWRSFIWYSAIVPILLVPIAKDLHLRSVMHRQDPPPLQISLDSYENAICFFENNHKNISWGKFQQLHEK